MKTLSPAYCRVDCSKHREKQQEGLRLTWIHPGQMSWSPQTSSTTSAGPQVLVPHMPAFPKGHPASGYPWLQQHGKLQHARPRANLPCTSKRDDFNHETSLLLINGSHSSMKSQGSSSQLFKKSKVSQQDGKKALHRNLGSVISSTFPCQTAPQERSRECSAWITCPQSTSPIGTARR